MNILLWSSERKILVALSALLLLLMNPFVWADTPEGNYIDKFIAILPGILDRLLIQWQEECMCLKKLG